MTTTSSLICFWSQLNESVLECVRSSSLDTTAFVSQLTEYGMSFEKLTRILAYEGCRIYADKDCQPLTSCK